MDASELTVQVVEDSKAMVLLIRSCLELEGFRVIVAGDGKSALEQFHREMPDLVLLDIGLPEVDGLEVCRRVRAASSVPVIFLTGRASEVDVMEGFLAGADDYVTKPFIPNILMASVNAALRRYLARSQPVEDRLTKSPPELQLEPAHRALTANVLKR